MTTRTPFSLVRRRHTDRAPILLASEARAQARRSRGSRANPARPPPRCSSTPTTPSCSCSTTRPACSRPSRTFPSPTCAPTPSCSPRSPSSPRCRSSRPRRSPNGPNGPLMPELAAGGAEREVRRAQGRGQRLGQRRLRRRRCEATGRKTLVMAGVWTSVCVAFPALAGQGRRLQGLRGDGRLGRPERDGLAHHARAPRAGRHHPGDHQRRAGRVPAHLEPAGRGAAGARSTTSSCRTTGPRARATRGRRKRRRSDGPTRGASSASARRRIVAGRDARPRQQPAQAPAQEPADLIVPNAKIVTLEPQRPEAHGLRRAGTASSSRSGGDDGGAALRGDEHPRDRRAADARVIPGLNDSHLHAIRGGRFYNLELRWDGVESLERGPRDDPRAGAAHAARASGCA